MHMRTEALGGALIFLFLYSFLFIFFFSLLFFKKTFVGTEALGGALAWLRAQRSRSSPFVHEKLRPGFFFKIIKKLLFY